MRYPHLIHSLLIPVIALSCLSCRSNGRLGSRIKSGSKITPVSSYGSYQGVQAPAASISHAPQNARQNTANIPEWAKTPKPAPTQTVKKTAVVKTTTPALPQPSQKIVVIPAKTKSPMPAPKQVSEKAASASAKPKTITGAPSQYRGFTKRPPRAPAPIVPPPSPAPQE